MILYYNTYIIKHFKKLPEVTVTQIFRTQSNAKMLAFLQKLWRSKTPDEISAEVSSAVNPLQEGTIIRPKQKLNDMGCLNKTCFICADFGGTLFKVLSNGKEVKFNHENYVTLLSSQESRAELIAFMRKNSETWPKTVRITAGSLLKNDPDRTNKRNIKSLIVEFNKCSEIQIEGIEIENAVTNVIGRLYKAELDERIKIGHMLILGGPFSYAEVIVFKEEEMQYISRGKETTANPNSKLSFKFFYYFEALKKIRFNPLRHAVLIGPTGSNPTITLVDLPTREMTVYEFPTRNFDKSKPDGGWIGLPKQYNVTHMPIPEHVVDKFKM